MTIEFHPEASEELIEAATRYNGEVPGLGDAFVNEAERVARLIEEQPLIGQAINEKFRSILFASFPYSLIYTQEHGDIWVMAVAHQRKRPGYWKRRSWR